MRLDEILLRGTHAARPAASATATATLYYETDTETLWQNVANAWVEYGGPPGVAGGVTDEVTTASLVGKTMTFTNGVLTAFA